MLPSPVQGTSILSAPADIDLNGKLGPFDFLNMKMVSNQQLGPGHNMCESLKLSVHFKFYI